MLEDLSHEFEGYVVGEDGRFLSISEVYGEYIGDLLPFYDALDHDGRLVFVEEVFSDGTKNTCKERTTEGPCRVLNNDDSKLEELVHEKLHQNIVMGDRALTKIDV